MIITMASSIGAIPAPASALTVLLLPLLSCCGPLLKVFLHGHARGHARTNWRRSGVAHVDSPPPIALRARRMPCWSLKVGDAPLLQNYSNVPRGKSELQRWQNIKHEVPATDKNSSRLSKARQGKSRQVFPGDQRCGLSCASGDSHNNGEWEGPCLKVSRERERGTRGRSLQLGLAAFAALTKRQCKCPHTMLLVVGGACGRQTLFLVETLASFGLAWNGTSPPAGGRLF